MVAPYPAAAGLRRRMERMTANGEIMPPPLTANRAAGRNPDNNNNNNNNTATAAATTRRPRRAQRIRRSHIYCILSAILAIFAIVIAPSSHLNANNAGGGSELNNNDKNSRAFGNNNEHDHHHHHYDTDHADDHDLFQILFDAFLLFKPQQQQVQQQNKRPPAWIRWMLELPPHHHNSHHHHRHQKSKQAAMDNSWLSQRALSTASAWLVSWVDPTLLKPSPSTPTDILDKVLTSTPRLLIIANLLLSFTYLVHSAVAHVFLGQPLGANGGGGVVVGFADPSNNTANTTSKGGFLVFKLLLISAVVLPDTLDCLILLSWYTLLSFLKSLAQLASNTIQHTSQSGQAPRRGVLHLLLWVLVWNVLAAAACVALFHGAGLGMVLLLTSDCILLLLDVLAHILCHVGQAFDHEHSSQIHALEDEQIRIHAAAREEARQRQTSGEWQSAAANAGRNNDSAASAQVQQGNDESTPPPQMPPPSITAHLDRRMEALEHVHAHKLRVLETTVFWLQLVAHGVTVGHFIHIWSLHGLQFTLIDGVLAMHLHSALSGAAKKIVERRKFNRIARELDGMFQDANEMEMRKAGDVCCICLGAMSSPSGNVKKVGCGHLYHTQCLREVVERARSIEAARCPLCRAYVLDGRQPSNMSSRDNTNAPVQAVNIDRQQQPPQQQQQDGNNNAARDAAAVQAPVGGGGGDEHALFRFSTEGVLPAWVPLPAFSFEVVRRPPLPNAAADENVPVVPRAADGDAANDDAEDAPREATNVDNVEANRPARIPVWRRLLMLIGTGTVMTSEEEGDALESLVDMFPQYDRADLLRELRRRGSPEAVVEAVLVGRFTGVARGEQRQGANNEQVPLRLQDGGDGEAVAQEVR